MWTSRSTGYSPKCEWHDRELSGNINKQISLLTILD